MLDAQSPQLRFVNGAFRHVYSIVPPSPPPPPLPPPRAFSYGPAPPTPSPPPGTPPPFYSDAESCIPLPRMADFGLDGTVDAVADAPTEERASCVVVKRVLEQRRRASACFSEIAYPYPPPPPVATTKDAVKELNLRRQRWRLGDLETYAAPRKTDEAQWATDTTGAMQGTEALLDALGEDNPILQSLLNTALDEIRTTATDTAIPGGRRLLQRYEYNTRLTDALITHPVMTAYGKGGIPGVTAGSVSL